MPKQKKSKPKKEKIKIREIHPEEFESGLEKETKEEEFVSDEEFHEFLRPLDDGETPILKPIKFSSQELANLEQNVETFSKKTEQKEKEDDAIKYKTMSEDYEAIAQQSRRMRDEEFVIHQPLQMKRLEEQRIHLHDMPTENFQFNPELQEMRRRGEGNLERDYVAKVSGDFKEKKTHSPFEQQEKKYDFVK